MPTAALEGPPRPVVAGHTSNTTPGHQHGTQATTGQEQRRIPPGLEVVPTDLRHVVWRVVTIEAQQPGRATRWRIEANGRKVDAELERAVVLGYLAEGGAASTRGAEWWVPKHPRLVELVDHLRATPRSAAS